MLITPTRLAIDGRSKKSTATSHLKPIPGARIWADFPLKIDSKLRRPFHGRFDGFFGVEVLVIKKDALALPDQALCKTVAAGQLKAG